MRTSRLAMGLPLLVLVACARIGVTQTKPAMPKAASCPLDVYTSETEVKRPYEVVCLIDSQTAGTIFDQHTAAAAINQARPYACKCGADAILISGVGVEGPGMASGWGHGTAVVKGIRYTGPAADAK